MKYISDNILVKPITLIISIVFLITLLHYASIDANSQTYNTYIYVFTAIVPVILIFVFVTTKDFVLSNNNKYIIICIISSIMMVVSLSYMNSKALIIINLITNILLIFIALVGLAVTYNMFSNYFMKLEGIPRFIISIIFFIPCLITDAISSIINEFKIIPNITLTLLIIEIFLFLCYFLLPYLLNLSISLSNSGIELHKGKLFLDTKSMINLANSIDINDLKETNIVTRRIYSLSLWVYINVPEFSNTKFPIICYGSKEFPKPMMTYGYEKSNRQFMLNISCSSNEVVKILPPNQNWNYFVFNYNGSSTEIFVNGILEKTVDLSHNLPEYELSDLISIGSDSLGMNGAVANIYYHKYTLSPLQILGTYRLGINTIDL